MPIQSCVILGTDTGCGKTYISTRLLRLAAQSNQSAIGMKPVATGWDPTRSPETQEDIAALRSLSSPLPDINDQCPYLFAEPISPHLAARHAGRPIEEDRLKTAFLRLQTLADCIVVESAGGVLSPLNETHDMADLPALFNLPALLVVDLRLGCINQGRLAAEALDRRQVPMMGWVANHHLASSLAYEAEVIDTLKQAIPFPYWSFESLEQLA